MMEDELPRPAPRIIVGENLTTLSIQDLEERIDGLRSEIARTEEALTSKRSGLAAADAVFGKR
jgi:uncharacterized small protein (DUF1192 family)